MSQKQDLDVLRKRLIEISEIRIEQGFMNYKDPIGLEREFILRTFIEMLRNEIKNISKGILESKVGWKAPVIQSLRREDQILQSSAQRISWELFPEQFSEHTRQFALGAKNDPFYNPNVHITLSDVDTLTLDTHKASAEKRYRALIRSMRSCYIKRDPQGSL
jgi:hypothetical protein